MTEKKLVKNQPIVLDYADLRNTRFENCMMIFRGGRPPTMVDNEFVECEWVFENEAQNTLAFLSALSKSGGRDLVMNSLGIAEDG